MTEEMFWNFMEKEFKKGRLPMMSMSRLDASDSVMQAHIDYVESHEFLPKNYETIPEKMLIDMSELLFKQTVSIKAKKAVLIILAHRGIKKVLNALKKYAENPDKGLKTFARLAVDECELWME